MTMKSIYTKMVNYFFIIPQVEEGNDWKPELYFNTKGVMFKSSVKANGMELTAKDFLD